MEGRFLFASFRQGNAHLPHQEAGIHVLCHSFPQLVGEGELVVLDVGFDSSLSVIPLRIDHHSETINKVKGKNDKLVYNEKAKIYANVSIFV